jgi:hypothetical protein
MSTVMIVTKPQTSNPLLCGYAHSSKTAIVKQENWSVWKILLALEWSTSRQHHEKGSVWEFFGVSSHSKFQLLLAFACTLYSGWWLCVSCLYIIIQAFSLVITFSGGTLSFKYRQMSYLVYLCGSPPIHVSRSLSLLQNWSNVSSSDMSSLDFSGRQNNNCILWWEQGQWPKGMQNIWNSIQENKYLNKTPYNGK